MLIKLVKIVSVILMEWNSIRTLKGHSNKVLCLVNVRDGSLASASYDNTIKIWTICTGECIRTITGHLSSVCCIIQLKDDRLASGSYDNTIKLWNIDSGECIRTITGHEGAVHSIIQLKDGSIATGSHDSSIMVFKEVEKTSSFNPLSYLFPIKFS